MIIKRPANRNAPQPDPVSGDAMHAKYKPQIDNPVRGESNDRTTVVGVVMSLLGLIALAISINTANTVLTDTASDWAANPSGVSREALMPDAILRLISAPVLLVVGILILIRSKAAIRFVQVALVLTTVRFLLNCVLVVPAHAAPQAERAAATLGGLAGLLTLWVVTVLIYWAVLRHLKRVLVTTEPRDGHIG